MDHPGTTLQSQVHLLQQDGPVVLFDFSIVYFYGMCVCGAEIMMQG